MKNCFLSIILVFVVMAGFSQELKCRVTISAKDQQESERDFYNNMRKSIEDMMNNTVWTDNVFDAKEKIEMNISISIKQKSDNTFDATLQIQSNRPVYKSRYNSLMLNVVDDKFKFKYQEFETLDFDEQSFNSNLTFTLAYYAYIVLGMDYDSFSLNGGTKWYQKAEAMVNIAQGQSEYTGWKAYENKENRYWLVENLLNSAYANYRNAIYMYHRLGLDIMSDKTNEGRAKITEALGEMEKVNKQKPGLFELVIFFQAKNKELQDIYSDAQPDEKTRVVTMLKKMDPGRASDYDKILSQK